MEIPYRGGQAAMAVGLVMLLLGILANPVLIPIIIVGGYGSVRAFRSWSDLSGDATMWAGVPVICAAIVGAFSLFSGVAGWMVWTGATFVLLLLGWLGARDHAVRLRRRWQLERELRTDPGEPDAGRRAPREYGA
ncbi:MAG: hypothetical protein R6U94_03075 [Nitriliruptoraceae bacterium]